MTLALAVRVRVDQMESLPRRLYNWRRWLKARGAVYGQCDSIEGNYRSRGSKVYYPPGPRPIEAQAADAWDITMACATLTVRLHLVLKLKYFYEDQDSFIAEIFRREFRDRTKEIDIPHITWEAKTALLEALSLPMVVRRERAVQKARRIIAKVKDEMRD